VTAKYSGGINKMRNMKTALICAAALGFALVASPANAGSIMPKESSIDFSSAGPKNIQHAGGTVEFTRGFGNVLTIFNAPIYELLAPAGSHGPSKNGLYAITGGEMNVRTGACMTYCMGMNGDGFQAANFSGVGSSLTITGEIAGLGINAPELLVAGFFSNLGSNAPASHVSLNKSTNPNDPGAGGMSSFLDITYINPMIVDLLHLKGAGGEGQLSQIYFDLDVLLGSHTWGGQIEGSDLNVALTPTPEPANIMLLGSALLSAAWMLRRRNEI
jgi:hypothetical protein